MRFTGNNSPDGHHLYNECKKMMNYHVILTMQDGSQVDGIIESVDPNSVNVLVGEDAIYREDEPNLQRQFASPTRFRRFRRRNFPLATLLALSLLPYPYYATPYPYFPFPY